jgi:lysophospholipase L1-like esterase
MTEARRPAIVLGLVALALVVLGRPWAALVPVLGIALALQLAHLAPGLLSRLTERVGDAAARVVALVLLVPVFALVFVPVAGVLRLLGLDPLGAAGGGWRSTRAARALSPTRAFADDRHQRSGGDPRGSWRVGLALVALGALLAVVVPEVVDRGDPEADVPTALRGGGHDPFRAPALAGLDWTEEASAEFGAVSSGLTSTSYVGSSLIDHEGRYVNVSGRVRASYEAAPVAGQEPLDVWFFGGSTMFGFSAQRDDHTIPSEVVRLAEADGTTVRARNFGAPGYVNFQETVLLAQVLASGERPDLVVFYDGINDLAVQIQQVFGGIGTPGDPADISAFAVRDLLAGVLTGTAAPPAALVPTPPPHRPPTAEDVVAGLQQVYGQGLDLSRALAEHYGFPVRHFWQPDLFNKAELVPGEVEVVEALGIDDAEYEASRRLSLAAVAGLPADVTDVSDAFDGATEPILTDQVHTNELGARLVAEAMYESLRPALAELSAEA